MSATLNIAPASSADQIAAVRTLFREYQALLGVDLSFQGFESELDDLPGDYVPPGGRLYLATHDGNAVGCVALRAFSGPRCEMKRLFVRPSARGLGVGRALVSVILDEARTIGYSEVVRETLPTMSDGQRL